MKFIKKIYNKLNWLPSKLKKRKNKGYPKINKGEKKIIITTRKRT